MRRSTFVAFERTLASENRDSAKSVVSEDRSGHGDRGGTGVWRNLRMASRVSSAVARVQSPGRLLGPGRARLLFPPLQAAPRRDPRIWARKISVQNQLGGPREAGCRGLVGQRSRHALLRRILRSVLVVAAMVGALGCPQVSPKERAPVQADNGCVPCNAGAESFTTHRCEVTCDAGCMKIACDGGLDVPIIRGFSE